MAGRTTTLGILGTDARTAGIVAAARSRGWHVFGAADTAAEPPAGLQPWTALLDAETCDAAIVGADGWNPARAEAVRTLVQAGRALVLAQPLDPSMLWAYELDMIARDSGARLVPVLPDRLHPCLAALRAALDAPAANPGPLGLVESLHLERSMVDRSRETVVTALSRDVDIVRALMGDPDRVATLGAGDTETAWASLAVGFAWASRIPARWQAVAGGEPGLRITLLHARGSLEVFAPDGPGPWTASPSLPQAVPFDRGDVILDRLAVVLDDGFTRPPAAIPPATWPDAARALEIAEAVPRSLTKGRAIDLHREEFSDVGTFKGTMASLGCGLVLAALASLVLVLLVAGMARNLGRDVGLVRAWAFTMLAIFVAFLALQSLPLLVGPNRRQPPGGNPTPRA